MEHTLATARLRLRPPTAGDAPDIARMAGDRDVARQGVRIPHPYTLGDAQTFLSRAAAGDPARERTWAITREEDGRLLGVIGVFTEDDGLPELGYWLGREAWGQGLATEAARAVMAWSDSAWRARVVTAACFTDNPASARVLRKAGFLDTGVVQLQASLARSAPHPSQGFVRIA